MPVPSGNASVNRILAYSKGMVKLGHKVKVISTGYNDIKSGEINGVFFFNLAPFKAKGAMKAFILFISLIKVIVKLTATKFDVVIIASNGLPLIYALYLISKFKGAKYIQEKSEYPEVYFRGSFLDKLSWYKYFYINTTYKLYDGMILISDALKDYFARRTRKKCKLIVVPITVDMDRFSIDRQNSKYDDYIAYCGNMSGNKDGVEYLIRICNIVEKKHPEVKFVLMGGTNKKENFDKLTALNKSLGNKNLIFTGPINRDAIPQMLINAKVLVLARPNNKQAQGGFPTKLGEYLATGNPVVVTTVGPIPKHLTDGKDAYLVDPDNVEAFADKINYVLDHYEDAKNVGANGKKYCNNVFNADVQAKEIDEYLKKLF